MAVYNLGRVTNGFIILGYYNDLAALQAAISSPSIGDAYGVGVIAPYTIYVWNGSVWKDNGTLKGEKGDKGDDGAPSTVPGPTGPANSLSIGTVQSGANAAATITGTAPTQTLNLTLPKGETGAASAVPGPAGNDGEDGRGIVSIIRTSGNGAAGTTDTYTITYTDATTDTFTVHNGTNGSDGVDGSDGNGIASIELLSTVGLVKTYRINFADTTHFDFVVTDGSNGTNGTNGTSYYVWIKWAAAQPDSDDDISDTPNEYMGIYSGTSSTAPTAWNAYTWYKVKGASGSGSGDMLKATYDPNNKVADAFNVDNHVNGTTNKVFTATEQSKLSGIDDNANNYTHPTTAGNKHIPAGGSSGQVLKYNADGEAKWDTDNDTIYTHPTTEGNKHIPSGGSAGKILKYKAAGEAEWADTPADDAKADKVTSPTAGNFAGLDANGNLTDSGKKDADYEDAGAVSAHNSDSGAHSTQFAGKLDKSGGTMSGDLTANNPAVADAKVRNISAGTTDLTAGTSELASGALYFVYE